MQFRAFEPDIEVSGQAVSAVVEQFDQFRKNVSRLMLDEGIGVAGDDGRVVVDRNAWFSQEAWLRVFERIAAQIGSSMLYNIGLAIPRNAIFPPWVGDVYSAVRSIDVAYHLNHRKNGIVMCDESSGRLEEGIGHYGYTPVEGQRRILSVCENPYPCDFDRGIITSIVRQFEPHAFVEHDDTKPCRKNGADSCTYAVTW